MVLKTSKCQIGVTEAPLLGLMLKDGQLTIGKDRAKILQQLSKAKSLTHLRSMIGKFQYLRAFIPNFSKLISPLTDLTKEGHNYTPAKWTQVHEDALQKLKAAVLTSPALIPFKQDWKICLLTDASDEYLGCVLGQRNPETGKIHPVEYASKRLSPAEKKWTTTEKEFYAICFALEKWKTLVYLEEIDVYTDHKALIHYKQFNYRTPRLERMLMNILPHKLSCLTICYNILSFIYSSLQWNISSTEI
jgi:hypothetical protein